MSASIKRQDEIGSVAASSGMMRSRERRKAHLVTVFPNVAPAFDGIEAHLSGGLPGRCVSTSPSTSMSSLSATHRLLYSPRAACRVSAEVGF
jgi:hypothetical protein